MAPNKSITGIGDKLRSLVSTMEYQQQPRINTTPKPQDGEVLSQLYTVNGHSTLRTRFHMNRTRLLMGFYQNRFSLQMGWWKHHFCSDWTRRARLCTKRYSVAARRRKDSNLLYREERLRSCREGKHKTLPLFTKPTNFIHTKAPRLEASHVTCLHSSLFFWSQRLVDSKFYFQRHESHE